jgi:hypothetical protein
MTWYADLSDYECLPESVPAGHRGVNVGWLAPGHDFPTGDAPDDFVDELGALCAGHAYAQTRGFHGCAFPHENGDIEQSLLGIDVTINGKQVALGSAEVRVAGEGDTILIAPNLIWHYVTYHRYLPPQEFIDAVLARRPGTLEVNPWDPVR